jgi:hypothetical protein
MRGIRETEICDENTKPNHQNFHLAGTPLFGSSRLTLNTLQVKNDAVVSYSVRAYRKKFNV